MLVITATLHYILVAVLQDAEIERGSLLMRTEKLSVKKDCDVSKKYIGKVGEIQHTAQVGMLPANQQSRFCIPRHKSAIHAAGLVGKKPNLNRITEDVSGAKSFKFL